MKRLTLLTTAMLALVTLQPAKASELLTVTLDAKTDAPVVACLGTKERPSLHGGISIHEGQGTLVIPETVQTLSELDRLHVFVSDGDRGYMSGSVGLYEGPIQALLQGPAVKGCTPSDGTSLMRHLKAMTEKMEELAPVFLSGEGGEDAFAFLKETNESLTVSAQSNMPAGSVRIASAVEAAMLELDRAEAARKRSEDVERFFDAVREYGEQREREREQRRAQIEAERAAEEAQKQAELDAEAAAAEVDQEKRYYCFGAVGNDCGSISFEGIKMSSCHPNLIGGRHTCIVNVGSWLHDECCDDNPDGFLCGGDETSRVCEAEFDLAWDRTASPFSWARRDVDSRKANTTGIVTKRDMCAKPDKAVLKTDSHRCCLGARDMNGGEEFAWRLFMGPWGGYAPDMDVCARR